jgi:hypothetical protein
LPAGIAGTDGWRRLRRWRVAFGPPVDVDDLRGGDPQRSARDATARLWEAIVSLERSLERGA